MTSFLQGEKTAARRPKRPQWPQGSRKRHAVRKGSPDAGRRAKRKGCCVGQRLMAEPAHGCSFFQDREQGRRDGPGWTFFPKERKRPMTRHSHGQLTFKPNVFQT